MTDSVLVMGSGMTGLLHIQLAKAQGAGRIFATDLSDYKLNAAKDFGADYAFHADQDIASNIKEVNEGRLADMVVVCIGAKSAILQAFDPVEPGGTILFFAPSGPDTKIEIPFNDLWWSGVKTLSSYAASPSDLVLALELIRSKRVNVADMVTHRLPLSETGKGFSMVEEGGDSIKIIVEPHK
jgi:L-iditol 2-dehydrogenase